MNRWGVTDEELREAQSYSVIVEWSEIDQLYLARIPDLEGLTVHGGTPEEALSRSTEAALDWLYGMRALGEPIPAPRPSLMPSR